MIDYKYKVGDRVIRISGEANNMVVGDKGTVIATSLDGWLRIKEFRGFMLHEPNRFKLLLTT